MRGSRYLIGAIPIIFSVTAVGVVRNTPVILRIPSFWAVCRVCIRPFCRCPVNQTGAPYVSIGMTYMRYTCFQCTRSRPRTELPSMDKPRIVDLALMAMIDTCGRQSRVGVRKKPRYLSRVVALSWWCVLWGSVYFAPCALGPRYLLGEKIISSVLSKSTLSPLAWSHLRHSSSFDIAFVAALYGVADTVSMAPSSTYSDRDEWCHEELRVSRYEVKIALKIGDNGEPCGVPSGIGKGSRFVASNRMDAIRLVRNEKIQFTILGGKPFFSKMLRVLEASM